MHISPRKKCFQRSDAATRVGFDVGSGDRVFPSAKRVWKETAPENWTVVTRDLFAEFGEMQVTAVELFSPDGGTGHFDHLYLAATPDDFEHALTPQATGAKDSSVGK